MRAQPLSWAVAMVATVAAGALIRPAGAQPARISTGPDPTVDGYLDVAPDEYGSWAVPFAGGAGPNDDHFNPSGAPGAAQAAFTSGFFLFVPAAGQRELLSDNTDWQGVYPADASLARMVTASNAAADTNGDGVADALTSGFRVFGGATDLDFSVQQSVSTLGSGAALLTQTYLVTNNTGAPVDVHLVRAFDGDFSWMGDLADDEVGTTTNSAGLGPFVFEQESLLPGVTAVTLSSLSASAYYGGKRGIDPDGPGGDPPYDFGTDTDVWNAFGVPLAWRDHIAGVGHGLDGTSGAAPPGSTPPEDAFIGLEFQLDLDPFETRALTVHHVYGATTPPPPGCLVGGEIPESEPCGVETNGGCNVVPTEYVQATCGESYSGTSSAELGEIDQDWYLVDMPAGGDLEVELRSEFPGMVTILAGVGGPGEPCPAPVVMGTGQSSRCVPGFASATNLPPGPYAIVVEPIFPDKLPCGAPGTGYVLTPLPVPPIAAPGGGGCVPENRGACCLPTGNCSVMLPGDCTTAGGSFQGLLSNCSIPPCQACCLPDGSCLYTADSDECASAGGTLQGQSMSGGGASVQACCFDDGRCCRRLTQVVCEAEGGTFQAFNNCENCPDIGCTGDTNGDGAVDVSDLTNVILCWGTSGVDCPSPGDDTDTDDDGTVGVGDLTSVILNWGPCPPRSCAG